MKLIAVIAVLAVGAVAVQEMPKPSSPHEEHEWLHQLVGEWTVKGEATMEPDTEPMQMESTESVRSIGGLWILSEGKADFDGMPFTSIMTLGYDPAKGAFVGTWIDTMHPYMWLYEGELDDEKKVLTLETEGPMFADPTQTTAYRDVIELKSADHKVLTSSMKGEDGTWTTFMRADFRRKK